MLSTSAEREDVYGAADQVAVQLPVRKAQDGEVEGDVSLKDIEK